MRDAARAAERCESPAHDAVTRSMRAAVSRAVPDGLSFFCAWCSSTISASGKKSRRLLREAHHQRGADRKVRHEQRAHAAIAPPARASAARCSSLQPLAPTTVRTTVRDGRERDLVAGRLRRQIEQNVGLAREHFVERREDRAFRIGRAREPAAVFAAFAAKPRVRRCPCVPSPPQPQRASGLRSLDLFERRVFEHQHLLARRSGNRSSRGRHLRRRRCFRSALRPTSDGARDRRP